MREYWNKPAETAEAFRGGWFHSGDLVRQDPEGYYYVVDRKKDMIISGGENIYCAEVENALAGHPKVADVAVVGVPHARWGETPLAVVVPLDPADPPTRRRDRGVLPRAAGRLQAPDADLGRRRAAAQPERQGAQDPAARGQRGGHARLGTGRLTRARSRPRGVPPARPPVRRLGRRPPRRARRAPGPRRRRARLGAGARSDREAADAPQPLDALPDLVGDIVVRRRHALAAPGLPRATSRRTRR